MITQYVNESGYKINATEKAYNLFYRKQGFKPAKVSEAQPEPEKEPAEEPEAQPELEDPTDWTVPKLKEVLKATGVLFKSSATKAELLELLTKGGQEEPDDT